MLGRLRAGAGLDVEGGCPNCQLRRRLPDASRRPPGLGSVIVGGMCRSIKQLRNEQPATQEEIRAAALQFVRKVSGYRQPSKANTEAFDQAVERISSASQELLTSLTRR